MRLAFSIYSLDERWCNY